MPQLHDYSGQLRQAAINASWTEFLQDSAPAADPAPAPPSSEASAEFEVQLSAEQRRRRMWARLGMRHTSTRADLRTTR